MHVNFYISTPEGKKPIAGVELEVVPNSIYEIDGVDYIPVGKPHFHIKETRDGHALTHVDMIVSKL